MNSRKRELISRTSPEGELISHTSSEGELIKHKSEDWDKHFMKMARVVSEMSKDPSTQVGAIIVKDKVIYGTGYNGFPKDVPDFRHEYDDRPTKLAKIIHAEENAIQNAVSVPDGFTVYVYPFMPCTRCFQLLKRHNVSKIVTYKVLHDSKWESDWEKVRKECRELGIEVVELV